jgi:hypothetical protein
MGDADTACQGTPCAWDGFTEKKVLMHGILISHAVALCLYWSKASEHFLWVRCSCMSVKLFHSIEWKCRLRRFRQNFLKDCRRTSRYWHGLRRRGTRFRPWIVLKFISTCWNTVTEQPRIEARLREDFLIRGYFRVPDERLRCQVSWHMGVHGPGAKICSHIRFKDSFICFNCSSFL